MITVPHPENVPLISAIKDDSSTDRLWEDVVNCIASVGAQALFRQQGKLVFYDNKLARVAIDSRALFKMANNQLPNLEKAFQSVLGADIVVSLEVLPSNTSSLYPSLFALPVHMDSPPF